MFGGRKDIRFPYYMFNESKTFGSWRITVIVVAAIFVFLASSVIIPNIHNKHVREAAYNSACRVWWTYDALDQYRNKTGHLPSLATTEITGVHILADSELVKEIPIKDAWDQYIDIHTENHHVTVRSAGSDKRFDANLPHRETASKGYDEDIVLTDGDFMRGPFDINVYHLGCGPTPRLLHLPS